MKTGLKILISIALAPIMSLLLIYLLFWGKNEFGSLILVHILTIIGTRLLLKMNFCHIGALYTGFPLTAFACCVYEANSISDITVLPFLVTFIITLFYVLPAMFFVAINIYVAQKGR